MKTLHKAWAAIQRNARTSKSETTKNEIATFTENLQTNLDRIQRELQQKTFKFPPAKGVRIPKDKKNRDNFRPLVVAKVESRIIQRAIHDVLITVPSIQEFVFTSYSFGGVKKRHDDELAAVPAAIQSVLNAIQAGGKFIIRSDISSFFTRIPKSTVTDIIAKSIDDSEFLDLFSRAIAVELENMAELKSHANAFPTEDIGVAQGNSLSPLLGNLILYDFDCELNKDADVHCIRYIDDFIIIAPNKQVAENTFSKALDRLKKMGMSVSESKTQRAKIEDGFEFLGIELSNGFIRPNNKARQRLLASVESTFAKSETAFREFPKSGELVTTLSLLETLTKISGIMQGWGKHYRFCNDSKCFERLDEEVTVLLRKYLSIYRDERERLNDAERWKLLGIESLAQIKRKPFLWPKRDKKGPV